MNEISHVANIFSVASMGLSFVLFYQIRSKVVGVVHKPNSVSVLDCPATDDNHSSSGYRLPGTSCNRPGSSGGPPSDASLFGFAPDGVYPASPVTRRTGALLPHRFTLTRHQAKNRLMPGGLLSVALAFASPRLHVMEHPALWCSDFPPVV